MPADNNGPPPEQLPAKVPATTRPYAGINELDPLSLYMIPRSSIVRIVAWKVTQSFVFWTMTQAVVLIYCLSLMLRYGNGQKALDHVLLPLMCCLFLETVLKVLARGFIVHKNAYLRDPV